MRLWHGKVGGTAILCAWLGSLAALTAAEIRPHPVDGKIQWVYSYAEGRARAKESGKPLFIVFRCEH